MTEVRLSGVVKRGPIKLIFKNKLKTGKKWVRKTHQAKTRPTVAGYEDERGHKPRNVEASRSWKRQERMDLP